MPACELPDTAPAYIAEILAKFPHLPNINENAIAGIGYAPGSVNTIALAAKEYLQRGFSVIPLKRDKKPAVAWKEFQTRKMTAAELNKWFGSGTYNIGIVTGAISGITVVDFDTTEAMALSKQNGTPKGPVVKTSKGAHIYCRYEVGHKNFQKRADLPGIDLRAEGGYVAAPPSVHETGHVYKWLPGYGLDDIEPDTLPEWVLAKSDRDKTPTADLYNAKAGSRNESLTRLLGSWLHDHKDITLPDLVQMALLWNKNLDSALPESEVERTCQSIFNRHNNSRTLTYLPTRKLNVVNFAEMINRDIPRRELILPWLTQQSLAMLYAWRGVGKTWVSLGIAIAVATGGRFLKWQANKPYKVIYLDGEMPAYAIQERLRMLTPDGFPHPENLQILTPDFQPEGMPDLATLAGQAEIDALIDEDTTLIIVDNISALCRSGKENEAEGWIPVQTWALKQRAAGRSVLFIHHAGKGGAQRGSSKREDLLDTVIMLKRPGGYSADQGAIFEVHFEKARHLAGEETIPFVAKLDANGTASWTMLDIENSVFDKVVELFKLGLKKGEIAAELGVNKSTVSRNVQKAEAAGLIKKK